MDARIRRISWSVVFFTQSININKICAFLSASPFCWVICWHNSWTHITRNVINNIQTEWNCYLVVVIRIGLLLHRKNSKYLPIEWLDLNFIQSKCLFPRWESEHWKCFDTKITMHKVYTNLFVHYYWQMSRNQNHFDEDKLVRLLPRISRYLCRIKYNTFCWLNSDGFLGNFTSISGFGKALPKA